VENAFDKREFMNFPFKHRDVIAIQDFSKEEILYLIDQTQLIKKKPPQDLLKGYILANCFFEPSTRTRLSFESAMLKLGGSVIGFADMQATSSKKGESLHDTIKMIHHYADLLVIRHPYEGAAQLAADAADIPVINAGDGANQHPTQTFLDLFSIWESQGSLDNLNIAIVGDLKYGRAAHSLAQGLSHFKSRLYLVSPQGLELPKEISNELRQQGTKFSFHKALEEVVDILDICYMTRLQEERFAHKLEYQLLKNSYILKPEHLQNVRPNFKVMHPLPRIFEIDMGVDQTPYAFYFQQAQNGLFTRQALMSLILGQVL
jgi:aspartate carbamoyltransferase catalytic subunit